MSKSDKKIPATEVKLGMYVTRLDREWLGTPFPFQGFYIQTDAEIEALSTTCKFIYIDTERQDPIDDLKNAAPDAHIDKQHCEPSSGAEQPTVAEKRQQANAVRPVTVLDEIASRKSLFRRVAWILTKKRKVPFEKEFRRAAEVFETAQNTITNVMGVLRAGGELDIRAVKQIVAPMLESVLRNPDAMACMVSMRKKDDYTYNHAMATAVWALVFGRHLGLDHVDLESLATGALLQDVGKTKIPIELLQKKGPLEADEFEEVKRHVEYGLQILKDTGIVDSSVETIVRTHHERHDGSGYPKGLSGNEIPVSGRITGIIDTFNAMTAVRPYAAAMSPYSVMRHLLDNADILFQAEIVERFIQVVGMFPTGTLVELNTGEVAIVMHQNPVRRLRPKVMLILDENKEMRKDFPIIDLRELPVDANDPGAVWINCGLDFGAFGIDPGAYYL
jgi:putative nucleotidyltransferase with HDIG domain